MGLMLMADCTTFLCRLKAFLFSKQKCFFNAKQITDSFLSFLRSGYQSRQKMRITFFFFSQH